MAVQMTYAVRGMTCEHCVQAVTNELTALPGVRDVRVDLADGSVQISSDAPLPLDEIRAAVDEAGYALAGSDG